MKPKDMKPKEMKPKEMTPEEVVAKAMEEDPSMPEEREEVKRLDGEVVKAVEELSKAEKVFAEAVRKRNSYLNDLYEKYQGIRPFGEE
jgi:hypothetical protein